MSHTMPHPTEWLRDGGNKVTWIKELRTRTNVSLAAAVSEWDRMSAETYVDRRVELKAKLLGMVEQLHLKAQQADGLAQAVALLAGQLTEARKEVEQLKARHPDDNTLCIDGVFYERHHEQEDDSCDGCAFIQGKIRGRGPLSHACALGRHKSALLDGKRVSEDDFTSDPYYLPCDGRIWLKVGE